MTEPIKSPRQLSQIMLTRVLELEDENRRLRIEVSDLTDAYSALLSKNRLFHAKILELQARLLNPARPAERYRSPLVLAPDGKVTYRFERPSSARVERNDGNAKLLSLNVKKPLTSRESTQPSPRETAFRFTSTPRSHHSGKSANWQFSANPTATERIYSELERMSGHQRKKASNPTTDANHEETSAQAMIAEALGKLQADLSAGRVARGTSLVVKIEYCSVAHGEKGPAGYSEARYAEAAAELREAICITFAGWGVECRIDKKDWAAGEGGLAAGALEVWLGWHTHGGGRPEWAPIFSKLRTRRWPDTLALLSPLLSLVSCHSAVFVAAAAADAAPGDAAGVLVDVDAAPPAQEADSDTP